MLYMGKRLLTKSDPAMQVAKSNSRVGGLGAAGLIRKGDTHAAQADIMCGMSLPGHIFLVKSGLIWVSHYDMHVLWPTPKTQ